MIKRTFIRTRQLKAGAVIDQAIVDRTGRILIARGTTLDDYLIEALLKMGIPGIYTREGEEDPEDENVPLETLETIEKLKVPDRAKVQLSESVKARVSEGIQYLYSNTDSDSFSDTANNIANDLMKAITDNDAIAIDINTLKVSDEYTFKHSVDVATMAMVIARKYGMSKKEVFEIGVSGLLHDLGKMVNPMYYTENQIGVNPLNELPYDEAAQVIISHVQEGVKIAEKWNLPYQIIEFISMHHGASKVKYFYNSFKNKYPDREIDEVKFTYPGPLPATKETAILMMSDAVEAASRSLKSYDEESISKLVENVVNGQIADGQFKNSPISFRDVEVAKRVFVEKLQNIYHTRIQYPELKNNKDDKNALGEINKTLKKVRTPYRFQKK